MKYPSLTQVRVDYKTVRAELGKVGIPAKLINSIATKALRTGRKITGKHATNRQARWAIATSNPQYANERNSLIVFIRLAGMLFEFRNAPKPTKRLRKILERSYFEEPIKRGAYKDALLLEPLDYAVLEAECFAPVHGHAAYQLGHQDPTLRRRHVPSNVAWRTNRSNLIQGNMTLRESRIYIIKLIGRYFELGELRIK